MMQYRMSNTLWRDKSQQVACSDLISMFVYSKKKAGILRDYKLFSIDKTLDTVLVRH